MMINKLPNGRFRVSVLCQDGVRRSRTYRHEGTAKLAEAIFKAGWFDGSAKRSVKHSRKQKITRWSLANCMAKVLGCKATHKKGRY